MTTNKTTLAESVWLYENSYGSAYKVSRAKIISLLIVACIVTPCTNWLIPLVPRFVKSGLIVRY